MKTKKLYLSVLCIIIGCMGFARNTNNNVQANGDEEYGDGLSRKVVSLGSTPLKKLIKGSERNMIKTLVVTGGYGIAPVSEENIAFYSKMQNLETLDLSDCTNLWLSYFKRVNNKTLGIKSLIVSNKDVLQKDSEKSDIDEISDNLYLFSRNKDIVELSMKMFPNLEELKVCKVANPCNLDVPDSLYDDITVFNGYTRIFLLKQGAVVFKKNVDLSTVAANKIYSKAVLTAENFNIEENVSKSQGKVVIPASVFYVKSGIFDKAVQKSVIFEKSPNTIFVASQSHARSDISLQEILCYRPIHIGLNAFANISANNVVFEEHTFMHNPRFAHINNLTFNGDANISGNVCASGNTLNVNSSINLSEPTQRFSHNPDFDEFTFGGFDTANFREAVNIPNNTFASLTEATFKKEPILAEHFADRWSKPGCPAIIVPEGSSESMLAKLGAKYRVIETSASGKKIRRTYNIQIKKPGTLLSVIPLDDLYFVDSLTISGFMYDTDLKVLSECKRLKYLDLSKAYPMYSPETQRQMDSELELFNAMGQLVGATADAKYVKGKMGDSDYIIAKGFAALMADESNVKKSGKSCIIPGDILQNCRSLETLLLPYRCSEIGHDAFRGCTNLRTVKLPLYLKTIRRGAFSYCENLKRVDFPATITDMGIRGAGSGYLSAFGGSGIEEMDLSKCTFEKTTWKCDLQQCKNLKVLKLPKNIERIEDLSLREGNTHLYLPATIQTRYRATSLGKFIHFKSATPPMFSFEKNFEEGQTLYIPKGSMTAYYAHFGSSCKYVEEY